MLRKERQFIGKMESTPAPSGERHHDPVTYHNAGHTVRDFWRLNTSSDHHHQPETEYHVEDSGVRGGQAIADMHRHHHHAETYPCSYEAPLKPHAVPVEVSQGVYYTNLCHPGYAQGDSPYGSSTSRPLRAHPTYTNFFNQGSCSVDGSDSDTRNGTMHGLHEPIYDILRNDHHVYNYNALLPPSAEPVNRFVFDAPSDSSRENLNRDMESLRQKLKNKCPQSNDLLLAITSTAQATVQEQGTPAADDDDDDEDEYDYDDDDDDDEDEDEDEDDDDDDHVEAEEPSHQRTLFELERSQELRAAIIEHPYYAEMVVAHIRIFKIGAPRELRDKLDDITMKFQQFQDRNTMQLGDDPELDSLMKSYVDLLGKLGEDMEKPFNKFMEFKDATTKQLEELCGYRVNTEPNETDNYGYDVDSGPISEEVAIEELERIKKDQNTLYPFNDVDESVIIDSTLPDRELKKKLMRRYGRHNIDELKAEFHRVRKKGKLPSTARNVLKDWFIRHVYWPYPSEVEKDYLQRICNLNLRQINNWFINERKRHWSCEGRCMHPNKKT